MFYITELPYWTIILKIKNKFDGKLQSYRVPQNCIILKSQSDCDLEWQGKLHFSNSYLIKKKMAQKKLIDFQKVVT